MLAGTILPIGSRCQKSAHNLVTGNLHKTDSALCNCQYKNLKPPFDTLICRVKKAENPFAFSVRDYSAFLSSDLPVRMSLMINFDHYSSVSVLAVSVPFFHASNFFITAS